MRQASATTHTPGCAEQLWDTFRLPLLIVGLSAIGIVLIQMLFPEKRPLVVHGVTDELGHLLTAFVFAVTVRSLGVPLPVGAVLIGGVILDLGHIPDRFGITETITGSSRNGSHSLFAVAVIAAIALGAPRHRLVWVGLALGALSHLWRDMGTGTVPLGWPFVTSVYSMTFARSLVLLLGVSCVLTGIGSAVNLVICRRCEHGDGSTIDDDSQR